MAELTLEQKRAIAMAQARQRAAQAAQPARRPEPFNVLPFSESPDGSISFDSNAGLLGAVKRAVTLPGDVLTGQVQLRDPDTGRISDEALGRTHELGLLMSPANPAVRAGDKLIPGAARNIRKANPKVPTAKELLKAGSEGFDAMRATGAEYPAAQVKSVADALMVKLNEKGFDEQTASKTIKTLRKLASPPDNSVATIGNLHSARKTFGKIGQNFNDPSDQAAARAVVDALDEFITGRGGESVSAGPRTGIQEKAGELLRSANANFAAGKRSDLVQGIDRSAARRANAANSGKNIGNTIRQRVVSALEQPKKISGFDSDETKLLESLVKGSRFANATRDIGNLLGGGGGLGGFISIGAGAGAGSALGGVPGAAIGAAAAKGTGAGMRSLSNRATLKALQQADEAIRMRSPLFQQRLADAPLVPFRDQGTEALIRALLLGQAGSQR